MRFFQLPDHNEGSLIMRTFFAAIVCASYLATVAGCAPSGYYYKAGSFTPTPLNPCATSAMSEKLLAGLHKTPGMAGASFVDVTTVEAESETTASCHGTVVVANGSRIPGTITYTLAADSTLRADWKADFHVPVPPPVRVATTFPNAQKCSVPPYGGSVAGFKAFTKNFGGILDTPGKTLSAVCRAKFGGDRTTLYNLGFTDQDISTKDTADLAYEMMLAIKNVADKTP
jgi:hypothetical protein